MSRVLYGRSPIVIIDVVDTVVYEKKTIVDQRGNYVATKYRLIVQGVLSRRLNAYSGPPGGAPRSIAGTTQGVLSDIAIRHVLAQPRLPLAYIVGDVTVFSTGTFGDAANGPVPLEVPTVTQVIGSPYIHIRMGWEVTINEARQTTRPPPLPGTPVNISITALASLTYNQSETIGRDGYSEILTTGRAVFRGDRLRALGVATIDAYRGWLIMPTTGYTKRERIHVTAEEDGNTLTFAVLDKEVYVSITNPNISWIEGTHSVTAVSPSNEQLVLTGLRGIADIWRAISGGGGGGVGTGFRPAAGHVMSWLHGAMPQLEHNIKVRVWGYSNVAHPAIALVANIVLGSRLAFVRANGGVQLHNALLTQTVDLVGSFVEVSATYTSGLLAGFAANLFLAAPDMSRYFPPVTVPASIANTMVCQGDIPRGGVAPAPGSMSGPVITLIPTDRGRRGNTIAAVAAQAIAAQDTLQAQTAYPARPLALTP